MFLMPKQVLEMKVKLIKSITVNGGKAKKGDILDESPKVVQKLILRGYATDNLTEEPMVYAPDLPEQEPKDVNKSSK